MWAVAIFPVPRWLTVLKYLQLIMSCSYQNSACNIVICFKDVTKNLKLIVKNRDTYLTPSKTNGKCIFLKAINIRAPSKSKYMAISLYEPLRMLWGRLLMLIWTFWTSFRHCVLAFDVSRGHSTLRSRQNLVKNSIFYVYLLFFTSFRLQMCIIQ